MPRIVLGYITSPSKESAEFIADSLLKKKLIACGNIIEGVTSLFSWEGENKKESEVILICKTSEEKVKEVTEEVKKLHEYEGPCVVFLPIIGGNEEFLEWMDGEVRSENEEL